MSILKLTGVRVDGDAVTCTGSQIATVLRALEARPALAKCDWYAGALDGYGLRIPEFEEFALKPVNSMIDLIEQIAAVPQLLDGIIVAVPLTQEPAIGSRLWRFTCSTPPGLRSIPTTRPCSAL